MRRTPLSMRAALGVVAVLTLLTVACSKSTLPADKAIPVTANFTITVGHSFTPFIQAVPNNTTVAFINKDIINHDLVSGMNSNAFLNQVTFTSMLLPHSQQATTFTPPGLYDIYDDVLSTWNNDQNRVAARQGNPVSATTPYPSTVECLLWVQGDIAGLTASAQTSFSDTTDNFADEYLAITKGGTVTWQNTSQSPMTLQTVPGWAAPINPVAIPSTTIAPNGVATLTFATPGLYYYYSPTYADVDPTTHRAVAHITATGYPIPAEGFVLVV